MNRRARIGLVTVFCFVGLLVAIFALRAPEPTYHYQGKSVSAWLDEVDKPKGDWNGAQTALQKIGPSAAPYVLSRLQRNDSAWAKHYRRLWQITPALVRRILRKPNESKFSEAHAVNALSAIGPPVVPWLIDSLNAHSAKLRMTAAWTLRKLPGARMDLLPRTQRTR